MNGKSYGDYTYNVTAVLQGKESEKSNDFIVQYGPPVAPTLIGFDFYMKPPVYNYTPIVVLKDYRLDL